MSGVDGAIRKVAAAVLSDDGSRLLVVRKRGRDVFILPGGKPEPGESSIQTLARELGEELGTGIVEARPLMGVADWAAFEDVPLDMEVFLVTLDREPHPGREIEEIAFVPATYAESGLRLATGVTHHVLPRLFGELVRQAGPEPVAVLFSGGRDSTAVALVLHAAGHPLHLLSFSSGLGVDDGLRALRLAELAHAWSPGSFEFHQLPVAGLVREICFRDLVADVMTDERQLILLGEALAMMARALEFCGRHRVRRLAMGVTSYQSHYAEQQPAAIAAFEDLCREFDVTFLTPGAHWSSDLEVKERLRLAGLSAKSLESSSLLADLDDYPPEQTVRAYLARKLPWVRNFLSSAMDRIE